jgi:hypothetical protein
VQIKAGIRGAPAIDRWRAARHIPPFCKDRRNTLRYDIGQRSSKGLPEEVMPTRRKFVAGATGALIVAAVRDAQAQANYPDRPIRIIAGYRPAAGSIWWHG